MRILPHHIQLDLLTVPHLVREKQVQCWRVAFPVSLFVHVQFGGCPVFSFGDSARPKPMVVVDVVTQGGHEHGGVVGLVGVFTRDVVGDVIEREAHFLITLHRAFISDITVCHFVRYVLVVAVTQVVLQRKLRLALVMGGHEVAIHKARSEGRLYPCHHVSAIVRLLQHKVDDARGITVEVADAGVVAVLDAQDLLRPDIDEAVERHFLSVDLQNRCATINSDILLCHIHL